MATVLTSVPERDPLVHRVRTFTALVEEVGRLHADVQGHDLLFRGQGAAFAHEDGSHCVLPRLYRNGPAQPKEFRSLLQCVRRANDELLLNDAYARRWTGVEALLAHYEQRNTRMLDCTHILHVAASFALAAYGNDHRGPAVVYALDVSGSGPKPAPGKLGKALVAATTGGAALRPIRQAAWVIWRANAETEVVDFGHLVRGAFLIAEEDRQGFWDCHGPLDHAWLMRGDEMLDWFRAH